MNIKLEPTGVLEIAGILKNCLNTESSFIVHHLGLRYLDIRILSYVGKYVYYLRAIPYFEKEMYFAGPCKEYCQIYDSFEKHTHFH